MKKATFLRQTEFIFEPLQYLPMTACPVPFQDTDKTIAKWIWFFHSIGCNDATVQSTKLREFELHFVRLNYIGWNILASRVKINYFVNIQSTLKREIQSLFSKTCTQWQQSGFKTARAEVSVLNFPALHIAGLDFESEGTSRVVALRFCGCSWRWWYIAVDGVCSLFKWLSKVRTIYDESQRFL